MTQSPLATLAINFQNYFWHIMEDIIPKVAHVLTREYQN